MTSKTIFHDFSERSLKTLFYAQEEALAFNSRCVGSEHLLLGIIAEGSPGAGGLLVARGLSLSRARDVVSKNTNPELQSRGPRWFKRLFSFFKGLPFSPDLIAVFEKTAARDLSMITPGHLLLDILNHKSEKVLQILQSEDIEIELLEREILSKVE